MAYSVSYAIQNGAQLGSQGISVVSDTQQHPLGTIVQAYDGTYGMGEFVYAKGVASCAQGSWVLYSPDDYATTLLVADAVGPVAIAMAATVANTFGWFQISGKSVGKVLASFADNGLCYTTSTAGSVDDAVVAGELIHRALGASAIDTPATGYAEIELNRPHCQNGPTV